MLLQVTDTGKGIPPEDAQAVPAWLHHQGQGHEGIGLSVTESILRALGGRILCRSHEGRGTIFIVMLPRRVAG